MNVMVTGCSGYIGSVMCKLLKEKGHRVLGVDINYCQHKYTDIFLLENVRAPKVARVVAEFKPEAIFHFAASADVGESVTNPALFYHNNVGVTTELLDNVIKAGWNGHFVFSSTAAVYGVKEEQCTEDSELTPCNPYGDSKLMCERALTTIAKAHGIKLTMFRYFNVAGALDDVGDHLTTNHIIVKLCKAAYEKQPFTLYGNVYRTPDGSCIRDYIHVVDICEAHLTAVTSQKQKIGVYNLGSGIGFSNIAMVDAFRRFTGQYVFMQVGFIRQGDPDYLVAHPKRFTIDTGFKYLHTNLERMLLSSWNYYKMKRDQSGI